MHVGIATLNYWRLIISDKTTLDITRTHGSPDSPKTSHQQLMTIQESSNKTILKILHST